MRVCVCECVCACVCVRACVHVFLQVHIHVLLPMALDHDTPWTAPMFKSVTFWVVKLLPMNSLHFSSILAMEGSMNLLGDSVGVSERNMAVSLGKKVGKSVGDLVGGVGERVVGDRVGWRVVGERVGRRVVGWRVGRLVARRVGATVGVSELYCVKFVGENVGELVGIRVTSGLTHV